MSRQISSLILLTTVLATSIVTIDIRSAEANLICKLYPSMCGYPNPGGRTPSSPNLSPESLEVAIKQGKATINTYITLGYIYWQMNKFLLSRDRYNTALELATKSNDLPNQAIALAGLGEVSVSVGNTKRAAQYFRRAIGILAVLHWGK
jgi:Tfp pilus assembly protein PilF